MTVLTLDALDGIDDALTAAEQAARPAEKFVAAHLAALRVAAIALAGRPRRRGSLRQDGAPRSIWRVLPEVAPELGEWATYFGALQLKKQAVQAGAVALVTEREADDLVRGARAFRDLVVGSGHG